MDHILFEAGLDWKKREVVKPLLKGTVYQDSLRKELLALEAQYKITSHDRHMIQDLAFPADGVKEAA